jgi:bacterioferritin-associated ferredoxin
VILCLCHAVSDREVDDLIRRGAQTAAAVGQMCGAGTDCGSCVEAIEERICRGTGSRCAGPQARGHEAQAQATAGH